MRLHSNFKYVDLNCVLKLQAETANISSPPANILFRLTSETIPTTPAAIRQLSAPGCVGAGIVAVADIALSSGTRADVGVVVVADIGVFGGVCIDVGAGVIGCEHAHGRTCSVTGT